MIRLSKSIHEVLPATGAIENVGGKADRSLRAFNRLKHGRICLGAIGQWHNVVPFYQGPCRHSLDKPGEQME